MRIQLVGGLFAILCIAAVSSEVRAEDPPAAKDTKPPAPPAKSFAQLRVAAVQMRSTRDFAKNIELTRQHIEQCAKRRIRVAVFPECNVTGYFDKPYMEAFTTEQLADAERQIADACRANKIYAIVGMPHRAGDKLYNSAIVIDPAGNILERYHKMQLAESWPVGGDHLSVFPIDGVPCSIIVCHDERYPELVRLPVLAGSRVVFYLSHESGIDQEKKLGPYRAQIQARAVENTVYIVQANAPANKDATGSHGQSRVIAPDGNILKEASMFDEEVVAATINPNIATGKMARMSISRGTLGDWWKEGVSRVRMIDAATETTQTEQKAQP